MPPGDTLEILPFNSQFLIEMFMDRALAIIASSCWGEEDNVDEQDPRPEDNADEQERSTASGGTVVEDKEGGLAVEKKEVQSSSSTSAEDEDQGSSGAVEDTLKITAPPIERPLTPTAVSATKSRFLEATFGELLVALMLSLKEDDQDMVRAAESLLFTSFACLSMAQVLRQAFELAHLV